MAADAHRRDEVLGALIDGDDLVTLVSSWPRGEALQALDVVMRDYCMQLDMSLRGDAHPSIQPDAADFLRRYDELWRARVACGGI